MITFLVGKKTETFQKALDKVVSGAGEIERKNITGENINSVFDELQTHDLFGNKKTFIISGLSDSEEARKEFLDRGLELENAPNDIVVIMENLLVADVKKAEKFATVQKVEEKKSSEGKSGFDPFGLTTAFAAGDKKQAWIAFSQIVAHGDEMEPMHGLVWWKLKDMMTKRSIFSETQLQAMVRDLVSVYHESRLGGLGMRERLEKFFLTLPTIQK